MKESFYQWVKTLAVFYILFSAVLHLIPDTEYETLHPLVYGTASDLYSVYACFCRFREGERTGGNFFRQIYTGNADA